MSFHGNSETLGHRLNLAKRILGNAPGGILPSHFASRAPFFGSLFSPEIYPPPRVLPFSRNPFSHPSSTIPVPRSNPSTSKTMENPATRVLSSHPAGPPCTGMLSSERRSYRRRSAGPGRVPAPSAPGAISACCPLAPDLASSAATSFTSAGDLASSWPCLAGLPFETAPSAQLK